MNKSQNMVLSRKTKIAEWLLEDDTTTIKSKNNTIDRLRVYTQVVENIKACLGMRHTSFRTVVPSGEIKKEGKELRSEGFT